jgi:DNA-binding NarL/FixJ family response regulator
MARILVVDDQAVYRMGLRSLICTQMLGAEVLEASSLPQALPEIQNGAFDLVLLGLDLSNSETVDALTSAREASPATRFAIISATDARADILASLAAGLHGFISKHQSDAAILDAIAYLLSGRIYVPRSLAEADDGEASASRGDTEGEPLFSTKADRLKLTKRQREVLGLLALGMSNKEIARTLEIAEATTKIHMAALLRALGVRNRTEAAYKAGQLLKSAKLAPPEDHGIKKNRRDLHGPEPLRDRRRQVGLVRVHGTGMR